MSAEETGAAMAVWVCISDTGPVFGRLSDMGTISVSVPEDMRRFVDDRVARAGFGTPSEYMCHLIKEDRKRVAQQQLDGLLLAGLDSGPAEPWTEADVEGIRSTVRAALAKGRRADGADTQG